MVIKLLRRPSQKRHLIETAISLVAERGVAALTIENLAQAAGVTKGGVQYHFDSKDQLVTELLEVMLSSFDEAITAAAGAHPSAQDWLRAYVAVSLTPQGTEESVAAALIAAMPPGDPRAAPFNVFNGIWRERAQRDIQDKALAQVIRLACDSVWLEKVYGGLSATDVETLRTRLLKLIDTLQ
jgi:AcrR family transcriptional regulator